MAGYKRRRFRKRRGLRSKRRRFGYRRRYRRGGLKAAIQRQILRNAEKKYIHFTMPSNFGSIPGTSWTEINVTTLSQGDDNDNYIGREFRIKKMYFYGYLQGGQGAIADDAYNQFRIIIAHWTAAGGPTPCNTAVVDLDSQVQKQLYPNYLIKKYYDHHFIIQPKVLQAAGDFQPVFKKIKFIKVFRGAGLRIRRDTAGNWLSRVIISMISDSSAPNHPGFVSGNFQMQYYDI